MFFFPVQNKSGNTIKGTVEGVYGNGSLGPAMGMGTPRASQRGSVVCNRGNP